MQLLIQSLSSLMRSLKLQIRLIALKSRVTHQLVRPQWTVVEVCLMKLKAKWKSLKMKMME